MKITRFIFLLIAISFSCKNETAENKTSKKDTLVSNISTDTLTNLNANTSDGIKNYLDSLTKAGVKFSVTTSGGDNIETRGEAATENLKASDLKLINTHILDSLITRSKNKYILVHFWATWCGPCRSEFPKFIKAATKLKNTDVILVSSDYDSEEQRKKVLAVYKKLNTTLPVYITETPDKSDLINQGGQLSLIQQYDKKSDGGLPYNLLIENRNRMLIKGDSKYQELLSKIN